MKFYNYFPKWIGFGRKIFGNNFYEKGDSIYYLGFFVLDCVNWIEFNVDSFIEGIEGKTHKELLLEDR